MVGSVVIFGQMTPEIAVHYSVAEECGTIPLKNLFQRLHPSLQEVYSQ